MDWNIRLGRGHQPKPTQGERPARASTASRATIANGSFAYRYYTWTHLRIQGLSGLIDQVSFTYKLLSLLFSNMGKSKASKRKTDASGTDLEGSTRAKRYELKLFSILPPGLTGVGLSISFGIAEIFKKLFFFLVLFTVLLRIYQRIRKIRAASVFITSIHGGLTGNLPVTWLFIPVSRFPYS